MNVTGTFEVKMTREPPYDVVDNVALGRAHIEKRFEGALDAVGAVNMLSAGTAVQGSAAYSAIERVKGELLGKRGSFVLQHTGVMNRGESRLSISVVPDSGTGELAGIRGRMAIRIEGGKHFYDFDFELP
jgi:hypothetical protein